MADTQYHVVLYQSGRDRLGDLNGAVVTEIHRLLEREVKSAREETQFDVWLESPGGDAHAAYKLFSILRGRAKRVQIVIPDYAKSAATLLVLGADEVFMAEAAEIGPLDAQIGHPDREGVTVSALDVANAFDFLGRFAIELTVTGGAELLNSTGLPRSEVLKDTLHFVAQFLQPAVAKMDPSLVHRATQQLRIAREYGRMMLEKSGHENVSDHEKLARHFVENYPAHEFVITRTEAADLGLNVKNAEDHPRWSQIKQMYDEFCKHGKPLIRVLGDSSLVSPKPAAGKALK